MSRLARAAVALAASGVMAGGVLAGAGEAAAAPRYNSYFPALISGNAPMVGQWHGFLLNRSQTADAVRTGVATLGGGGAWWDRPIFSGCALAVRVADGKFGFTPVWKYSAIKDAPGTPENRAAWRYFSTQNFRCDGASTGGGGNSGGGGGGRGGAVTN